MGLVVFSAAGLLLPVFVPQVLRRTSNAGPRHSTLAGSGINWHAGQGTKCTASDAADHRLIGSLATVACLGAVGAAAVAVRRRTPQQGRRSKVVALAAAETEAGPWQPRMRGWSPSDLAEERQRAQGLEGPEAGYTGPRYEGPTSVTAQFIDSLIAMQEKGGLLPKRDAYLMVLDFIDILKKEPTLQDVSIPAGKALTVVGDLHGQYWDFMNILTLTGRPSADAPMIFNGDFVDRGSWSIEVILSLIAFKLKDPGSVFLNRGNHEMLETNILYGFCGECGAKYDMALFDLFSEAFRRLPLCHLVEKKILVLHGGLPGPEPRIWMPGQTHDPTDAIPMTVLPSLEDIKAMDRYMEITPESYPQSLGPSTTDPEVNDMRKLIDILWGDPRGGTGYGPSYRKAKGVYMFGPDVTEKFCEQNGLQCIIRSHEVKAAGYRWDHPQLLSVFSAPNYLDTGKNQGAFAKLTRPTAGGDISVDIVSYDSVPHPDLSPMHWQENIVENYGHLLKIMKKKSYAKFDEFGDSDFEGLMNFDEWDEDEADQFQDAFKVDYYGRELPQSELPP